MPSPAFTDFYAKNKTVLSEVIRMCVDKEWEAAVVGQADDIVGIHADIVAVDAH
jgi:hypothetical protein